jgi:hypothetical protein
VRESPTQERRHSQSLATTRALAVGIACASFVAIPFAVHAQRAADPAPKWTAPRTADGHPDLQGVWANNNATPLERPAALAGKALLTDAEVAALRKKAEELFSGDGDAAFGDDVFTAIVAGAEKFKSSDPTTGTYNQFWIADRDIDNRTSLITDPPDGRLPALTPEAQARRASAPSQRGNNGPEDRSLSERCITFGAPRLQAAYNSYFQIFQTADQVAILMETIHDARIIPLDGRPHVGGNIPQWLGDSVGHWDGDTLVVDSVGFNDKTWTSRYGITHTESLRTTERYRRTDFGHMQVEVTYTDPESYVQPWGFKADMELAADTEMLEQVCERSSEHWSSSNSPTVTVPRDVLARYVGTYSGIYGGNKRTINVSLNGDQLMVKIVGAADIEGGLGTAGLNPDDPQPLLPRSDTLFEGFGLGFQFVVDGKGNPTDLVEIHISGPYKFPREK